MKTMKNLLFVAFAAITLASCVKEMDTQIGEKQKPGKMVTFTATLGSLNTKTMFHYEREVTVTYWSHRIKEDGKVDYYDDLIKEEQEKNKAGI